MDTSRKANSNHLSIKNVAVIGGGPAGSSVATFLARAGVKVALFMDEKRPELLIGESLIPGVIPVLAALGVEDEVASIGTFKPGATIQFTPDFEETFFFNVLDEPLHQYAFNVPRDKFDTILLQNAIKSGARLFNFNAKVSANYALDSVELTSETLQRTDGYFNQQPDLLIDCTGRTRSFARLLNIRENIGPRKDMAIFAHRDKASVQRRGNIHLTVFPEGWSWRIPLPGRVSVGVVANPEYLARFGSDAVEQYDNIFANDPLLAPTVAGSKRLTGVMKYNNYQLTSDRMHGANWVMLGDAAGFIDPVFSSGLCISLNGAEDLAKTILHEGKPGFAGYEQRTMDHLASWRLVVDSFYDQSFYKLSRFRARYVDRKGRLERARYEQISRIISGVDTRNPEMVKAYRDLLADISALSQDVAA